MELAEQVAYYDAHFDLAYERALQQMADCRVVLYVIGRERLIAGFDEFKDKSWHRTPEELRAEITEELADAPVWGVIKLHTEGVR